jgi:hypothetical protein
MKHRDQARPTLPWSERVPRTPGGIGEIEVDAPGMLGDTQVDLAFPPLELGTGLQQIDGGSERVSSYPRASGRP